jgi:hypothetical protein
MYCYSERRKRRRVLDSGVIDTASRVGPVRSESMYTVPLVVMLPSLGPARHTSHLEPLCPARNHYRDYIPSTLNSLAPRSRMTG